MFEGLAVVLMAGVAYVVLYATYKLITMPGEGARRMRLALGAALALGLSAFVLAVAGPAALAGLVTIIGVITWIVKGFSK